MENYKLRVKVGLFEFEAEGPEESVKAQFLEFKDMIVQLPPQPNSAPPPATPPAASPNLSVGSPSANSHAPLAEYLKGIDRLFYVDIKGDAITLKIHPVGEDRHRDAMLLILYAYKIFKNTEEVSVMDIKKSLQQSGLLGKDRIDRVAENYRKKQYILKGGSGKGGKYRLTNTGENKAVDIIKNLLTHIG